MLTYKRMKVNIIVSFILEMFKLILCAYSLLFICNVDNGSNDGQAKKRNGRGCTKKHNIWSRGDTPPIQLELNEYGQPVGENAKELANFIATIVKSKDISLAHKDWRLVDPAQKLKLWKDLKVISEIQLTCFISTIFVWV